MTPGWMRGEEVGLRRRVSATPPTPVTAAAGAFPVERLTIFGAKAITAQFTNSKKNPRKSSLAQLEPFHGHSSQRQDPGEAGARCNRENQPRVSARGDVCERGGSALGPHARAG